MAQPPQDPNAGGAPPQAGPPAPPEVGAVPPDGTQNQPGAQEGPEALLEPIQQMSDMIVQLAGPEALAQILEQGLQMVQQSGQQGPPQGGAPQPGGQMEAGPQPIPGGEAFGPQDGF